MKLAPFFFTLAALLPFLSPLQAAEWIDLWPGAAPGAPRPPAGSEKINDGWRYTDIEVPQYQLFKPAEPNGQALVILPGGGYSILAMAHEGTEIGQWCAERGITAIVVKYRVSGNDEFGYQFPVPQLDARRAIRTLRAHAAEWGVDAGRIGVMGSSAGGHLASTCATLFDQKLEKGEGDAIDALSCRPDFAVLLYPVIGMDQDWGHGGSARRLLGAEPSSELRTLCATYRQVSEQTPPVFLVHAADDSGVPLRNSAEFMSACAEKKVPVRAAIFPTGGHGFGWKGRGASEGWMTHLAAWLKTQ
ncbi:alpha/beta hydrolase [Roseibacillus ishigakijimensis]|uniref:Alpha/beta hydrolase n=1 Tax=Roseibacillus ishigakijimensis TaxID=454146 RepID=A0A934VLP4_9BACT|nr:alpha/beta hydrolase [Roseibacillus ishigakijimensis]MBK1833311.1 alpha/beta hydrolase [Roseibacillus ishigakijimensis]